MYNDGSLSIDTIELCALDETWVQVVADRGIMTELSEYFTFDVPGAQFMASYKNKMWDGKFRMLNLMTGRIYKGLAPYIAKWAKDNSYKCVMETGILTDGTKFDVAEFINTLDLKLTPFDFQEASIKHVIENNRACLLSPTSSGKSLIIYCLVRWFNEVIEGKILISVPTVSLVSQLFQDFKDYCPEWDVDGNVHLVFQGQEKVSPKKIYISTWQSVYKLKKDYFSLFDAIIVDETHTAKADALKGILEKATDCKYKVGLTGTLDGTECNKLVIEGLTGPVFQVTRTKDLMARGIVSELIVKCIILKYDEDTRKACAKLKYNEEMEFVVKHKPRTEFIKKTICATEGKNSLILTAYVAHVKELAKSFEGTGKEVYCVTGSMDATERERIRRLAETKTNLVIIATFGVFSTGISIKNLQYIFFATGSKSMIRVLQSIGRGLRLDGKDNKATVFDIVDDFSYKSKKNFLLRHFFERIKIYSKEDFKYKIFPISIK